MQIDAKTLQAFVELMNNKGFSEALGRFIRGTPWLPTIYNTNLQFVNLGFPPSKQKEPPTHSPWVIETTRHITIGLEAEESVSLSFAPARLHTMKASAISVSIDFTLMRHEDGDPDNEKPSVAFLLTYRTPAGEIIQIVGDPVVTPYDTTKRYTFPLETKSIDSEMLFEAVVGVTPMTKCVAIVRGVWVGQHI